MENENSCNTCNPNSFEIFTGEDKTMVLRAAFKATGLPLDLTDCTAIVVNLPNADGSIAALTLASGKVVIEDPLNYGQISVTIVNAVSALLNVGPRQNIDVDYTIGGLITTVRFWGGLTVLQSL